MKNVIIALFLVPILMIYCIFSSVAIAALVDVLAMKVILVIFYLLIVLYIVYRQLQKYKNVPSE